MKKNNLKLYLIISFIGAWLLQACAMVAFAAEDNMLYQISLMIMMYVPFIAVFFCERKFGDLGWKPDLKGKSKYFFIAWLLPGVMAIIGGALFFVFFRNAFDLSGKYMISTVGEEAYSEMVKQGITPINYLGISMVSAFTYAPVLNMFLALGEEIGWRGYMYPILKEKNGVLKGRLIGGFIWGVWHWPVMTIGYQYGVQYPGYPILGPLVFCVYAIACGIFLDWLYEKTEIIWIPSLAHGAINAATFGLLLINPDYAHLMILGPVPVGIISMIPMIIVAILICTKDKKSEEGLQNA